MLSTELLAKCHGRIRMSLTDGGVFTGSFRTDILSSSAVSVYFYGDESDISLPISLIASVESLGLELVAS